MLKNHFDDQAAFAAKQHAKEPLYVNNEQIHLGLNGFNAAYKWTIETAVEPLLQLAAQAERVRDAQRAFYAGGRSERLLTLAKREEIRLDDMIKALRAQKKLPEKKENPPATQGGIFS